MRDRKPPGPPTSQTAAKRAKPSLNPEIQAKIGKQLRAYYAGLMEPPPERFVELLRKLDDPADKGPSR